MKPSIGRIVHYVAYGTPGGEFPAGKCRAAMVTDVHEGGGEIRCDLLVMNPSGFFFNQMLAEHPGHDPGTWHWPERQPDEVPTTFKGD